jgi:GDPmannose 4,6-dehydratase
VGNTSIKRDWGWAPEYIEGMYSILQQDVPDDFVIATGKNTTLEEFIRKTFDYFDLQYKDYIDHDNSLVRPTDLIFSLGDPSKALKILNWSAKSYVDDVINMMIEDELGNNKA